MSPLDPSAIEQDLRLDALARQRWNNALDCIPIRQLCHMDPGFPADAVGDFIASRCVGLVSLLQSVDAISIHPFATYLDQDNISASLCQRKGHSLSNTSRPTGDHRGLSIHGEERCH